MRSRILWVPAVFLVAAAPVMGQESSGLHGLADRTMVPRVGAGPVHFQTSEAELVETLGEAVVEQGDVYVGEGSHQPGTILFPDSDDRLELLWHDLPNRRCPRFMISRDPESSWHTTDGIRIGTRMSEVVEANGAPLLITGFNWDYDGYVVDWSEGALDGLGIRFGLPPDTDDRLRGGELDQLLRLREVSSDHELVVRLDPVVLMMFVSLSTQSDIVTDCLAAPADPS